jgi:tRNA-dihydrouridine synthase
MGSGLIPFPEKIDDILNAAFQVGIKISVKIRLGWTSSEELEAVIPILNKYDLTEVIIHPRIGKQQYKGEVDLDAFERYAKMLKVPVGYSGDICTVDQMENLKSRFPFVDSWMIGRGAISNPIIFKTIEGAEPSRKEVALAVKQLHNLLFDEFSTTLSGPSHLMNKIKPYWDYFEVVFLPELKQLVKKTVKAGTVANYQAAANDLFAKASREFE